MRLLDFGVLRSVYFRHGIPGWKTSGEMGDGYLYTLKLTRNTTP